MKRFLSGLVPPLLVSAGLQAAHLVFLARSPLLKYLTLDLASYDRWARRIAAGDLVGRGVFYQDPLYPYLMALVYAVTGAQVLHVLVAQVFATLATIWAMARLGERLFSPAVARVAVWAAALYGPAVYYAGKPEKAATAALALTLALLLAEKARTGGRARDFLLCGLLLGAGSLLRGNVLLVALVLAALIAATRLFAAGAATRAAFAACLLGGLALALSPVLLRNRAVGGDWVFTTSQAGANLFIGNNPGNVSGTYGVPYFVRPAPAYEEEDFRRHAEHEEGRTLAPSEVSRFYVREVARWAVAEPGKFLRLQLTKALAFVDAWEYPDNWSIPFVRRFSPVLRLPLITYPFVVSFAALGLVLALRRPRDPGKTVLALLVLAYALSIVAFYVFSRYRYPIVFALLLFASSGLVWLVEAVRARRRAAAAAGAALVLAILAVSLFAKKNDEKGDLAQRFYNLATGLVGDDRLLEAKALAEEAHATNPKAHLPDLALAEIARRQGDTEAERKAIEDAYAAGPADDEVRARMVDWNARRSGYASAAQLASAWLAVRESYRVRQSLVTAAFDSGELGAAAFALEDLLKRYPQDAWALDKRVQLSVHARDWPAVIRDAEALLKAEGGARWWKVLAVAYRNADETELAERAAREAGLPWPLPANAMLDDPLAGAPPSVLEEARALAARGDYAKATAVLESAAASGKPSAVLFQYLSNIRYLAGDVPGARRALAQALALDPGNALYRRNLDALRAR
jgi:4-amino-4-deoxy-L-arabinose transferase-like glycosyltransferase